MDECGFRERLGLIRREWKRIHVCPLDADTDPAPCYECEALEIAETLLTWPPRIKAGQCPECGGYVCGGCGRGDC